MKQYILPLFNLSLFVWPSLYILTGFLLFSNAQNLSQDADLGISFPHNLNSPSVEFKLKSSGEKKFRIILDKKSSGNTKVKIYDLIGNLVLEDMIKPEDGTEKSFDFSHINSHLFVVEVGNSKYNKTKSIYAQPPGNPKPIGEE